MPKIPRLYKTQTTTIEGNEIELKGYRLVDNEYIVPLQEARNQLSKKSIELNKIAGNYQEDEPVKSEDLEKMTQIADEIDQLKPEVEELNHRIAQRGLKRFYYPEVKETDEIDALEDIEIDPENEILITNIMLNIGTPTTPGKESGKGKQRKKAEKKSSKASGKQS